MTLALLLLLKAAVSIIIFAVGLDLDAGRRHVAAAPPALLLRSLLAMYVLVPLGGRRSRQVATLAPGVEIGLLVLAVSAGAPLLPRKLMGIGDGGYTFSLVVISSVLAIVIVPAWLALLGPQFGAPPALEPATVAGCLPSRSSCPGSRHAGSLVVSRFRRAGGVARDRHRRDRPHAGCRDPAHLAMGDRAPHQMGRRPHPGGIDCDGPGDRPRVRRSDRGPSYGARHRLRDPPHRRRRTWSRPPCRGRGPSSSSRSTS